MRQAIEEGFILDVLENYTTYKAYWRLLKKIEDDPRYDKRKAEYLLKSFVELHPHAIGEKVRIWSSTSPPRCRIEIGGQAKAMIVTRSRLHAVRYKLAVDRYLAERGYPFKALVAFSGTVQDGGKTYTEAGMNGFPEAQTAKTFEQPEYRFLIVANKFQTGFDQPLLHTMYVDKKLGGVNAVQTLSRLNRTHPEKTGTMVLDFANEADDDQGRLRALLRDDAALGGHRPEPALRDPDAARRPSRSTPRPTSRPSPRSTSTPRRTQDRLYAVLLPLVERFEALGVDEQARLPRPAHRLRAPLRLPRPGADLRRRRSREALRLRPPPAPAAPSRPRGAAARGAAEHRHGVLPHPADRQRQRSPWSAATARSNPVGTKGGHTAPRRRSWRRSRGSSPS